MALITKAKTLYRSTSARGNILEPVALLFARLVAARVFFMSGQTKWNGFFSFNQNKYDLFMYEFFCPEEPRAGALVLCSNQAEGTYGETTQFIIERMANMAGIMEIVLPLLLVFGLFGRFAALGLLGMTMFIQLLVFPDWATWWGSHAWWAVALLIIVAKGPGMLSLDRYFGLDSAMQHKA